ncbi:MAG: FMN-binding protein [Actinomycetota bacterium]|nr:FMN-binding protein [Actinomycetota bacterium]
MRRAVPILLATLLGLVLILNFRTSPGSTVLTSPTGPTTPGEVKPTTTSTTTSRPPAGAPPNPLSPSTTSPPATLTNRTVEGPAEENRYGTVQVRVTLSGNRIVDVQAVQLPSDRSRSVQINDFAGPALREEALQAQSAKIHTVSGATYTSTGYRQSLQAALDQAGHS